MLCKCDREFNPNSPLHKPHGLYEQCNVCGMQLDKKRRVNRTLGLQGSGDSCNKGSCIEIFKNPSRVEKAMVRRSAKGGFNANLPLGGFSSGFAESKEAGDTNWKDSSVNKKNKK